MTLFTIYQKCVYEKFTAERAKEPIKFHAAHFFSKLQKLKERKIKFKLTLHLLLIYWLLICCLPLAEIVIK